MDTLLVMFPQEISAYPDDILLTSSEHEDKAVVTVGGREVFDRVVCGMRHAIAGLAERAHNPS